MKQYTLDDLGTCPRCNKDWLPETITLKRSEGFRSNLAGKMVEHDCGLSYSMPYMSANCLNVAIEGFSIVIGVCRITWNMTSKTVNLTPSIFNRKSLDMDIDLLPLDCTEEDIIRVFKLRVFL